MTKVILEPDESFESALKRFTKLSPASGESGHPIKPGNTPDSGAGTPVIQDGSE